MRICGRGRVGYDGGIYPLCRCTISRRATQLNTQDASLSCQNGRQKSQVLLHFPPHSTPLLPCHSSPLFRSSRGDGMKRLSVLGRLKRRFTTSVSCAEEEAEGGALVPVLALPFDDGPCHWCQMGLHPLAHFPSPGLASFLLDPWLRLSRHVSPLCRLHPSFRRNTSVRSGR